MEERELRILIVEDDKTSAAVLRQYLKATERTMAVNGAAAALEETERAIAEGRPFHAALLDIMMPTMNGLEVLEELRRREAERGIAVEDGMRIIMITALSDTDTYMRAFSSRCSGFLVKPVARDRLRGEFVRLGLLRE